MWVSLRLPLSFKTELLLELRNIPKINLISISENGKKPAVGYVSIGA